MKFVEYSDLKDFIGVTFAVDGSNDVIPKLWIVTWSASSMVCKWPNSTDGNVQKLCKEKRKPLPSWRTYEFKTLCQSSK